MKEFLGQAPKYLRVNNSISQFGYGPHVPTVDVAAVLGWKYNTGFVLQDDVDNSAVAEGKAGLSHTLASFGDLKMLDQSSPPVASMTLSSPPARQETVPVRRPLCDLANVCHVSVDVAGGLVVLRKTEKFERWRRKTRGCSVRCPSCQCMRLGCLCTAQCRNMPAGHKFGLPATAIGGIGPKSHNYVIFAIKG